MEQPTLSPELIRQAREAAGLTQAEAADRTGLTRRTIHNAENGKRSPAGYVLVAMARAYGCSMDAFVHAEHVATSAQGTPLNDGPRPHRCLGDDGDGVEGDDSDAQG